jgi:hypothetical protein
MESVEKEKGAKFELNKTDISKLGFDLSSDKPYSDIDAGSTRSSSPRSKRTSRSLILSALRFRRVLLRSNSTSTRWATVYLNSPLSTSSTTSLTSACSYRRPAVCT